MHKRKVPNLHKVVIDFSLFNARFILANNSFRSIDFTSNEDDWKNSPFGTIYKISDQIPDTRTNIECKLIKKRL